MQAKDVAKNALSSTQYLFEWFLSDFSDADVLVRPLPNANHAAWQIAHLISAEIHLLDGLLPGVHYPPLPDSIKSLASDKSGKEVPAGGYLSKAEYLDWSSKVRNATIAAVEKLSDSDLDKPTTGSMAKFAPNLGSMLIMTANHTLMHAGQFSVIRRALNKPVIM